MPKIKKFFDEKGDYHLVIRSIPGYFLVAVLLVAFYFLFKILAPFLTVLLIAAILATVFYPVYKWFLNKMPKRKKISSLITCFLVILIIVLPLTGFVILLTNEAVDTYASIEARVESGTFDGFIDKWTNGHLLNDFSKWVSPVIDMDSVDIKESIVKSAQAVSTFLVGQTANLLKSISSLLANFLIMLFSMYYFFKDGEMILKKLMHLSPLPTRHELLVVDKFRDVSKATIFGIFATAIAQGIVGGVGFAIAGIDHAIFWGTAMALLSLLPVIGTAIIWVPAAIILLIMQNWFGGLFLLIWGPIVIGSVDNLLRPYLIDTKAKLYPLLTFLTIFGGIIVFGLKGIIFGPLILALCMTLLHIYELEYQKVLKH
ncbi:MAG: AI-2E family transporter [bacterium]